MEAQQVTPKAIGFIRKKRSKSLVDTQPTLDIDNLQSRGAKTLPAASFTEEKFHQFYGVLLEKAKKFFRKGDVIISSRTSNRSLGQYALRTDAVGRAARAERKRRQKTNKKPKIRPAMKTLKRHLKGKLVTTKTLIKIAKAAAIASPKTIKTTIRRAGLEKRIENRLDLLKRKAREEGMQAGVAQERKRRRKKSVGVADTPAKQTLNVGGALIKATGIPSPTTINKAVLGQALAKTVEQTKLPSWFDPHYHYVGQDGNIYKWENFDIATGKQRPMKGQIKALSPRIDTPHEVAPNSGNESKLLGGPEHPQRKKWKLKIPRWGVKQEPSKPEIQAIQNPAPQGPIELKKSEPMKTLQQRKHDKLKQHYANYDQIQKEIKELSNSINVNDERLQHLDQRAEFAKSDSWRKFNLEKDWEQLHIHLEAQKKKLDRLVDTRNQLYSDIAKLEDEFGLSKKKK